MPERALSWVWIALLAGCEPAIAKAPPDVAATADTAAPPSSSTKAEATHRAEEGSRFQVGDYIVYRYTGSFTKLPVVLRQRVVEKNLLRVVIDVVAERGSERRRWIQVITDQPEHRKENVIDELYEVVGGERRRLENVGNKDLHRLYEWSQAPCTGEHREAGHADIELAVAGAKFHCTCTKALRECLGKDAQVETCECENFVWLYASGEATALDDRTAIWKATVERFGNAQR